MKNAIWIRLTVWSCAIFALSVPGLYAQHSWSELTASLANQERVVENSLTSAHLNQEVALSIENLSLEEALIHLAEQADLKLMYSRALLQQKTVTLESASITVYDALWRILEDTGLRFAISENRQLVLLRMDEQPEAAEEIQMVVSGQVTDSVTGEPLPGVNIMIAGTRVGTATDLDGGYDLQVPTGNETLIFTYIGYQRMEVPVGGRTQIDVQMRATAVTGDDVVVTALGIDREARALGYSVARVEPEAMTVNRTPNFMNALQGKLAGVNVSSMGTGPQGSSKVRIRGQSSFGGNNSPLIVVNGVPIDNTTFGVSGDLAERGTSRNSDSGDGLSSINPDDIVDMTVLKGAAAAALYGSRAKDGVIMITTRNRAVGTGVQVEYNSNVTFDIPMDFRDYQFEYGQGEGGQRPTSPFPESGVWSFGERFEPGMTHTLFDGVEVPYEPQRNQLREYYRNGYNLNNTITVSQGGENGGFSLSFANLTSQAILPGSDYNRNSVNLGFTQNVAERLTVSGNINYSNEDRKNPANIAEQDYSPVVIYTLATSMPTDLLREKAFTEEGDEMVWSRFTNRTNPYFALSRFENNVRDRVFGNLTLRYDLSDWLFVQGRVGQDYYMRDQEYNLPTGSQRQPPPPPGFVNGQYIQDQLSFRELNADLLLNANRTFGDYGFDLTLGGNQMYRKTDRYNVLVQDFYSRGSYTLGNGRVLDPQHNLSERQVNSVYGAAEVNYRQMVYLTGTLRNDWFSTLSPENRSILYPSVTSSFIMSDILEVPEWLTYWKINASYAEVGSDTYVAPYADNLFYTINPQLFRSNPLGGISGSIVPNPNLRPMRVNEWEVGFEVTLFDNVTVEAAFYEKISKDQILNQQISNSSGFTTQRINVGESMNRGVEMLVGVTPVRTQVFNWNANFNVSYNTTEVLDLGEEIGVESITMGTADFHGELRQVTGRPMNQLYGYGWLRDDQGRVVINPNNGIPMRSEQQLEFGSAIPKWIGGISNSFNYRNLSMSFLVDFKLGHKLISGTHINAYRHGLDKATLPGREEGFVIGEGVNPDGSVNTTPAPVQAYYEAIRTHRTSEQSVFNAGSWQLRQVTLGYDLTSLLPDHFGLRRVQFSAVANNVAVLKKWVPHIHPDQNGIISDARMGLEATGLPVTRSIGFNLNVQL